MSGPIKYNYAGIDATAQAGHAQIGRVQGQGEEISAVMNQLAAIWGGTSSTAYVELQTRLSSQLAEATASGRDLMSRLSQAGIDMNTTDTSNGALFHGV